MGQVSAGRASHSRSPQARGSYRTLRSCCHYHVCLQLISAHVAYGTFACVKEKFTGAELCVDEDQWNELPLSSKSKPRFSAKELEKQDLAELETIAQQHKVFCFLLSCAHRATCSAGDKQDWQPASACNRFEEANCEVWRRGAIVQRLRRV